jgi:hypothetical protein
MGIKELPVYELQLKTWMMMMIIIIIIIIIIVDLISSG